MSALFGEQVSDVEYSAEAVIPNSNISELTTHHESFHHQKLHEDIQPIGGKAIGELTLLEMEEQYD